MVASVRRWAGLALGAVLLAAGCSSAATETAVGHPLQVDVRHAGVEATAEVIVDEVHTQPVADLTPALQLAPEYLDGTVFLVTYQVRLIEGEYPPDSTYGFSEYNWTATGSEDADVATLQAFHRVDIEHCQLFDADLAAALASGQQISACTIFVSTQADASLSKVTYGKATVTRRSVGAGWHWTL